MGKGVENDTREVQDRQGRQEVIESDDGFLTVQQAAVASGVGETAIRNAILRGRLPHQKRYGRKLIKVDDLLTYQRDAKPGRPRKEDVS